MVQEGAQTFAAYQRKNVVIQQSSAYLLEVALVAAVVALVLLTLFLGEGAEGLFATLGMLGLAALRLKPAAGSISSALTTLRFQRDAVQRLFQDLRQLEQMERVETVGAVHTAAPFQTLELERVVFAYPRTKQPALREISLRIQAGESIGLIGPSGSGKTTLVDLLLGLLDPQEGQMRYNGMPLTEQVAEWRSQIAYLPQQVFLIDNTLRNNVALGENEAEIDDQRLTKALQQARLHELVEQLPHGVNTVLGERGVRLSGGQRQRVALARAFYHGRNILVMDEATSALDNETEQEIVSEIQRLKGQKTMIVIAHRLTTVQHCDRIYRLEQGRVVEQGTPEQVLRKVG
jgi:ABC-type multidrug transport system fused ATPase/permease subunit